MERRDTYNSLKGWMSEHDLTQVELAKALGTKPNYINKKINGTGPDFTLSEVREINRKFGIPIALFFEVKVPLKELT